MRTAVVTTFVLGFALVGAIRQVFIGGDIILGGLFPIHELGPNETVQCGKIKADQGLQRMVAMLYALETINNDPTVLPGIRLGAQILDTCSYETHALEQSLEFIKTVMSTADGLTCSDGSRASYQRQPIVAVVGAASSQISVMVASMLQLFKIPMLSYSSTGTDLSEKPRFEYFSRVVPPDNLQAKAMAHLVSKLNWTYVHAVADTGSYGERGMDSFRSAAIENGICIDGDIHKIGRKWDDTEFRDLINRMRRTNKARGVVMFVDEDNLRKFLNNLKDMIKSGAHPELKGYFWFVASDSWGRKQSVVKSRESVVAGAITVAPKIGFVEGFNEYFASLGPENTFLSEHWAAQRCSDRINENFGKCFNSTNYSFKQEAYVPFVVDSVNIMARALHEYIMDCKKFGHNKPSHCISKVKNPKDAYNFISGKHLQQYYRDKPILHNRTALIDANGDGIAQYTISQLDHRGVYSTVGQWLSGNDLQVDLEKIRNGIRAIDPAIDNPVSVCSQPCGRASYRSYQDQTCCWTCIPCDPKTSVIVNEVSCVKCPLGKVPNENLTECIDIIPTHLTWTNPWAYGPAIFAICGLIATGFVTYVFIRYNNTPVVMASGRELCYCMLFGIALCYTVTFVLVSKPSTFICSFQRIFIGLAMSAVYSAILVKTNRLARVFKANSPVRPKFISPPAQIGFCSIIVLLQMIVIAFFFFYDPPTTEITYPHDDIGVLSCKSATLNLFVSLGYNLTLIMFCTIYAVKTRTIPENFNESRLIGFTMYSTCILWMAFAPIYFVTSKTFEVQLSSLCSCISMSGTVALACFFAPKIYIVLFQPYKNVRNRHSAVGKLVNQQMRFISQLTTPQPHLPTDFSTNCTAVSIMDAKSSNLALSETMIPAVLTTRPLASVDPVPPASGVSSQMTKNLPHSVLAQPAASTTPLLEESALIVEEPKLEFPTPRPQSGARTRAQSLSAPSTMLPEASTITTTTINNNNNCTNKHPRRLSSAAITSYTASANQLISDDDIIIRRRPVLNSISSTAPSSQCNRSNNMHPLINEEYYTDDDDALSSDSVIHPGPVQLILREISADSFATFL